MVKNHGRKKAVLREIGPSKIKHLHAENGTFSRPFYGDGRENGAFEIKHLRGGGCLKMRSFIDVDHFLDRIYKINRIDRNGSTEYWLFSLSSDAVFHTRNPAPDLPHTIPPWSTGSYGS